MTRYERLEASRALRQGPDYTKPVPAPLEARQDAQRYTRTDFAVVNSAGTVIRSNLTRAAAEIEARRMTAQLSAAFEVAPTRGNYRNSKWKYLDNNDLRRSPNHQGAARKPEAVARSPGAGSYVRQNSIGRAIGEGSGGGPGRGLAGMSAARRSEISRAANAKRWGNR